MVIDDLIIVNKQLDTVKLLGETLADEVQESRHTSNELMLDSEREKDFCCQLVRDAREL